MVDVNVNFEFSEDEPLQSTFNVEPDVSFVADLSLETYKIPTHGELSGRDLPNQHPMTAITGLSDTLNLIDEKIGDETIRATLKENQLENSLNQKANISDLSSVATSGQYSDLIGVPTKLSDFSNDEGFIDNTVNNLSNYYLKSETYTKAEVQSLIAEIPTFSVQVLQQLPQTGEELVLYFIPKIGTAPDIYDEYIWIDDDSSFELIGNTQVDLTGYATETYVNNGLTTKQNTLTAGDNIQIQNNVISATDTTYTAGTGISIENGVISNTQTSAEWGNITGNIEDQTDLIELLDTKQDLLTSENAGNQIEIVEGGSGEDVTVSGNGSVFLEKAQANSLNSVTISGGLKRSLLPNGYTQYDYITVNGGCYFITDYYPNNNTEVKTKTFMHSQPTSPLVCRWAGSPTNDTFGFYMGNVSGRLTFYYGDYSAGKYIHISDVKLNIEHDIYMGVSSIKLDGTSYSITRSTFTSTQPIYIGAFNQTGTSLSGTMYGRIYPVKFIENGQVIRYYIPCKNNNGVIGLYEVITGTFISSTGTGTAKKGRPTINLDTIPDDYTRIDFLQSTGTQYIDSGVIANFSQNKIEQSATVEYTTSNANRELMGTNGYGFWGKNASNKIGAALGSMTVTDNALVKNVINWTTNPDGNALILNVNSNQYTSTASSFVNDNYAYYVFALGIRIDSGATASFLCHAKMYDYTIAIDDEVVCYLIPVKRNSDDVLGMYDIVTGTFKTNAGTGTFTAGSDVATPSPTNPIPIVSNNGQLKVGSHGKNLFNKDSSPYLTGVYISSSTVGQSTFYTTSNANYNVYRIEIEPNTTYTFGLIKASDPRWVVTDGSVILDTSNNGGGGAGTYITITTGATAKYLFLSVAVTGAYKCDDVLQLEKGAEHTTYEAFHYVLVADGVIETIEDSLEKVTGKNLFNGLLEYGSITNTGQPTESTTIRVRPTQAITLPAGTYTLSCNSNYEMYGVINGTAWLPSWASSRTITVSEATNTVMFALRNANDTTATLNLSDEFNVQIELGSTATAYEPYSISGTATAEMLLSVGENTDTQELLSGTVTRNVGIKVLDGTETGTWITSESGVCTKQLSDVGMTDAVSPTVNTSILSSHFVGSDYTPAKSIDNGIFITSNGYLGFSTSLIGTTDEQIDSYLAEQYANGTPVIVVYPLATPTTETVIGQTLTTISGDNTLTITQASIENLPITANYTQKGGTIINVDLTTIDGFDATKTQILKHINGTLTWVDE